MPYNDPIHQTADEIYQLQTQLTRLGSAIDKELTLISERMSWLVMSESFFFSAFTVAVANREKAMVLDVLVWLLPVVGSLLAILVYPALLAAHFAARRLKEERHQFEMKLPEDLRVKLLASPREHFLGSVPAFVIPVILVLVWGVVIGVLALAP
jgi:hypothetical protein